MSDRNKFHFDNVYQNNPRIFEDIILYQVGDLSCAGGYEIGEHVQYCYEISYVVSGKGCFLTNGHSWPVSAGDIFLNRPSERHNGIADQIDPFRYFYLGYDFRDSRDEPDSLDHIRKMLDQAHEPVVRDKSNIQEPFVHIFSEIINAGNYTDLMIRAFLNQILVLTYRNCFESWEKAYQPPDEGQNSRQIVYEVIHFIDANLDELTDLSRIATELGYSYSYLSRVFSLETGLGIQDYCQKKRFDRAADLLKNTDQSVTSIAQNLRYQSIHSFSKAFRKHFGLSPTDYQALHQKSQIRTNER